MAKAAKKQAVAVPQGPQLPQVLSENEVRSLREEKKELESTMNQSEFGRGTAAEQIDKKALAGQIRRIDSAIQAGTAPKLGGSQKDKLASEARQLAEAIKSGMPNQNEMDNPRKNPGAIRKNQLWEKNQRGNIERWKQVMRTIEPGDPTASNVERLRSR